MGFLSGALGKAIGAIGGLFGSSMDAKNDQKLANMNANFQREVYQNQYQWKVADAKKAGLHPLAVVGGGSYSASPVSSGGSTSYAQSLGKLGESIGDAAAAYMTKDEMAAEQAIREIREAKSFQSQQNESEARTDMYRANAQEARARAESYTRPMASGREVIPGQTDAPEGLTPLKKNKTGLISHKNSAIHVWYMGNGNYDINFNPDYQGTIGDEIGQLVNALKAGSRPARYYDVDLDRVFYYNPDTGYYQDVPVAGSPYSVFAPPNRSGGGGGI